MAENENPAPTSPAQPIPTESAPTLEQLIREKAPNVLAAIPGEKRAELAVRIEKHEFSMRSGPLPDPSELAAYNAIIPDGAHRLVKMAEDQTAHRINIETIVVTSQRTQAFCGQLFGLVIGLSGLCLATFAAVSGQPWFGGTIGGATLVSLVSVFLKTRKSQREELGEKQAQMIQVQQQILNRKNKNNKKRNR